jgi:hypothetical protein
MHSSSVAGREIFVSHNSGRITAYPEVIPKKFHLDHRLSGRYLSVTAELATNRPEPWHCT